MMSEVIKKKDVLSLINFYREIGVSTIAVPQKQVFDEKFIKKPKTSTIKTNKILPVEDRKSVV